MNKQKFIESLRDPSKLKENELSELDDLIKQYPYFQGARVLSAKAAKEKNRKDVGVKIASAAVYVTDRALLKKYINDHLFYIHPKDRKVDFTQDEVATKPKRREAAGKTLPKKTVEKEQPSASPKTAPEKKAVPSKGQQPTKTPPVTTAKKPPPPEPKAPDYSLDELIEEIYLDLEELKKSKARFNEVEKKLEEEDAVNAAILKAAQSKSPTPVVEEKSDNDNQQEDTVPSLKKEEDSLGGEKEKSEAPKKTTTKKKTATTRKKSSKASTTKSTADSKTEKSVSSRSTPKSESDKPSTRKSTAKGKAEKDPKEKELEARSSKKVEVEQEASSKAPTPVVDTSDEVLSGKEDKETVKEEKPETTKKNAPTKKESASVKEDTKADSEEAVQDKPEGEKAAEENTKKEIKEVKKEAESDTLKVVRRRSGKVKSTTYESRKSKEQEETELIEEFISKSPSISKPQKEQELDKKDLADKSSRFQADIGSEYLAEIYVEQGKVDRAIAIYEKLSLKFPEKKSFFASRIAELQSEKE